MELVTELVREFLGIARWASAYAVAVALGIRVSREARKWSLLRRTHPAPSPWCRCLNARTRVLHRLTGCPYHGP